MRSCRRAMLVSSAVAMAAAGLSGGASAAVGTGPVSGLVSSATAATTTTCGTPDPVYFLGIVYDEARRDDFKLDVQNFDFFLNQLRTTYCIPATQAEILAFENNYTDPVTGDSYAAGSEANLKARLADFASQANAATAPATFFFFLSSHGLMWTGALSNGACPATRLAGSFSELRAGDGEDGTLYDCELGEALGAFELDVRQFVAVDCSFCGGFSDSLTAVSGTIPDGSLPETSGVPGANRVVVTGCAITTECFGSEGGGTTYWNMHKVLDGGVAACDGWTAPGFPAIQGIDAPIKGAPLNPPDGRCTASEWFFGAVDAAYQSLDPIAVQQQFRIKYPMATLADDIRILGSP